MKKILLALCGGFILFAGCKENDALIVVTRAVDSTFTVPVPATTDAHNVLVEEFTGQSCSNCPAAHSLLESIVSHHAPGSVNVIGLYIDGNPQSVPNAFSKHDLRDSIASNIGTDVYGGVSQMPGAGIDRTPVAGILQLGSGSWSDFINSQLSITDPLNLSVQSSYNSTTGIAEITATIIYTQTVTVPQNISVAVVEDSIIDIQEYPITDPTYTSGYDTFYVFKSVFRGMVSTPPFGDPILAKITTKNPGQGYQIHYSYKPKSIVPAIVPAHCRVIAFVNTINGSDYHVVQSVQCKLTP